MQNIPKWIKTKNQVRVKCHQKSYRGDKKTPYDTIYDVQRKWAYPQPSPRPWSVEGISTVLGSGPTTMALNRWTQGGRYPSPCPLGRQDEGWIKFGTHCQFLGKRKGLTVHSVIGPRQRGRYLPPCPPVGRTKDGSNLGPTSSSFGKGKGERCIFRLQVPGREGRVVPFTVSPGRQDKGWINFGTHQYVSWEKGKVQRCTQLQVPKFETSFTYSPPSINITLINVNSLYLLTKSYFPPIANQNVNYVKC